MGQTDLGSYKTLYMRTAKEYVNKMLVSLNKLTKDALDKEALNNLHISSHSLKSQSQVMGYTDMAKMAEIIEKQSNDILNGVGQINDEFTVNLKNFIDKLSLELSRIEKTQ